MPDEGGLGEGLVLVGLRPVACVEADKGGHAALALCSVAACLMTQCYVFSIQRLSGFVGYLTRVA